MFEYEFILSETGSASLTQGGELMWSSDNDDDFWEEFGEEVLTTEDIDEVLEWLEDEGYLPPRVEVNVIDETDGDEPESDDDAEEA
jgi:hypothetical protein